MKIPENNEIRKPSKTLAGVTPIAVISKPKKCKHGTCLYCPSLNVPQSYTPKSPPVLRAERLRYDAFEQVLSRLKAFELMNHPTTKIELIIMGGNFLEYPIKYQYNFIKRCYDALNDFDNKKISNIDKEARGLSKKRSIEILKEELEQAKKKNERAKHRCVALCIETRPDTIGDNEIKRILEFGCTRVELGVQCIDNKIYKKINRGHKVNDVIEATKRLRNRGFKIGYHVMPGLPGSNLKKDFAMFKELFENEDFKPDQLKIYPCQVIKGAGLEKLYKKGKYKPYTQKQVESLLIKVMQIIPNYCRIMRIMREIPPDYLTAGVLRIDLRRDLEKSLKMQDSKINEIRFREIGFELRDSRNINNDLELNVTKYIASNGEEYFLEIVNSDNILFGLCRLRIFEENKTSNNQFYQQSNAKKLVVAKHSSSNHIFNQNFRSLKAQNNKTTEKKAFIRELHVYGQSLEIGKKAKFLGQHSGLGKQLMKKAEEITKSNKIKELNVISGVGVRKYYEKLGYKLDKNRIYMEKILR